jgi:16S rRNA U516 pseudouridylate synthase RsuA-like enzyme
MAKQNPKRSAKRKAEKARLRQEYEWIFINGKQKRVRRAPTIDGMDVDEFIRLNADPIWLHQEGLWEYLMPEEDQPTSEDFSLLETGDWAVVDTQCVGDLVES